MRRGGRWAWAALAALAAFMLAAPGFAGAWANAVSRPALRLLNRCTAPASFPVALLPGAALSCLLPGKKRPVKSDGNAASRVLSRGVPEALPPPSPRADADCGPPLRRRHGQGKRARVPGALARLALWLAAGYALLWLPLGLAPRPALPEPDADALAALCGRLVDALNASDLAFPGPDEALARAPSVAGLPGGRVKAAPWPGWMRRLRVAGFAVPWTGEAVVDASAPPGLLPFTAVHELTHIAGIADEGAVNLESWRRCMAAGEGFADSARLWALRYAAGMLAAIDEPRCAAALARLNGRAAETWHGLGGVIPPRPGGYHDLARWMAQENEESGMRNGG